MRKLRRRAVRTSNSVFLLPEAEFSHISADHGIDRLQLKVVSPGTFHSLPPHPHKRILRVLVSKVGLWGQKMSFLLTLLGGYGRTRVGAGLVTTSRPFIF